MSQPLSLTREQTEDLAMRVARFLENRTFTKHPHIGLIGPGTKTGETDRLELLSEEVESQTEQWLSPFVTGFRATLKRSGNDENRQVKICYSFSLRISAPTIAGQTSDVPESQQFRCVDFCFIIKEGDQPASVSLTVWDGHRESVLYSQEEQIGLQNGELRTRIPAHHFESSAQHLTTTGQLGYGSETCRDLRFRYEFSLAASLRPRAQGDELELNVKLMDLEGAYVNANDRVIGITDSNKLCRNQGLVDREHKSWSVGQLQEVQGVARAVGYEFNIQETEHGVAGIRPTNCAYDLGTLRDGELRFRDFAVVAEKGEEIRKSARSVHNFLSSALETFGQVFGISALERPRIAGALGDGLQQVIGGTDSLYTFQEDCTIKILESVRDNQPPATAVPISVQTAGGKTLAFIIPVTIYSFSQIQTSRGVKALIFYPTKALINDQSDTIVKLLWAFNSGMRQSGYQGRPLRFGIFHGDIKSKRDIASRLERGNQEEISEELRLKCPFPDCGSQLQITYRRIGTSGVAETIQCTGRINRDCPLLTDPEQRRFLTSMIALTRDTVYSDPPDILVCTPDMINYRLFFDPSQQSIFGRSLRRCTSCGYTTANPSERKPCPACGSQLEGPVKFSAPKILVFDEAHQLRGSFGSQVSHLMSRLEKAVRVLSGENDYRPVYVFGSATLARPKEFLRDFFGQNIPTKDLVQAEYIRESSDVKRIHLFLVPKGYSPEATLVQTLVSIFKNFQIRARYPNVLIFVNSLAESNELIHLINHHRGLLHESYHTLPPPVIDGHSTDYGSDQRTEVEDAFTGGRINVLVATSTLQVGVDFDKIDALVIYGAPFYLSDYVQRVGRAGRKHAALIVNILPDKPVDFFFFGNYPLVTNQSIRSAALNAEAVRISRDNERIRSRSAVRSLLDYLCTRPNSFKYFHGDGPTVGRTLLQVLFVEQIASRGPHALDEAAGPEQINSDLLSYVREAIKSDLSEQDLHVVFRTINTITERLSASGIVNLSQLFNLRVGFLDSIYAGDLRQSDYTVKVEHPDLTQIVRTRGNQAEDITRDRALSIAIGDYSPGQITSYRSLFFLVDHIESDPQMSGYIRESLYRRQPLPRREDL